MKEDVDPSAKAFNNRVGPKIMYGRGSVKHSRTEERPVNKCVLFRSCNVKRLKKVF